MFEFSYPVGLFKKNHFDPHTDMWPQKAMIRDNMNPNFNQKIEKKDNMVLMPGIGISLNLEDFYEIIDSPTANFIELIKKSENCIFGTFDDYDAEMFATQNKLICISIFTKEPKGGIFFAAVKPYYGDYEPYNMNYPFSESYPL